MKCFDFILSEAEKSKECVKERIETCNAPGVYHLYEVFYNKIMKFSNCDKVCIVN